MRRGWFPAAPAGAFPAAQGGRLPRGQRGPVRGSAPPRPPLQSPRNTPFFRCLKWVAGLPRNGPFLSGLSLSAIHRRCAADAPGANPVCDRVDLPPRSAKPPPFLLRIYIERYFPHLCNEVKYTIF